MRAETFTEDDKLLAKRLKESRQRAGYSQLGASHRVGMNKYSVRDIESNRRRVYAVELARLARLYKCTVGELLGETDNSIVNTVGPELYAIMSRLNGELKRTVLAHAQFLLWRSGGNHVR